MQRGEIDHSFMDLDNIIFEEMTESWKEKI